MKADSYLFTNKGGKEQNEDFSAYREEAGSGIYVAADGLGGYRHGDLASKCVAEAVLEAWDSEYDGDRSDWLEEQIKAANQKLMECQQELQCTMKSTIAALAIDGKKAVWANVGDTRLYYIHHREMVHMTEDHSVAYKKYKAGQITKAQINEDEDQSGLLRCLGGEERWEPDVYESTDGLAPGDGFLICTDGLWKYLCDEEILVDFLKAEKARDWAELLLLRVIDRIVPGSDNLTVLTVMVE